MPRRYFSSLPFLATMMIRAYCFLCRTSRSFPVRRLSTRIKQSMLGGRRPSRDDFYSQDEVFGQIRANRQQRPYPPALSDDMYDIGLDAFDLAHAEQETHLATNFDVHGPPPTLLEEPVVDTARLQRQSKKTTIVRNGPVSNQSAPSISPVAPSSRSYPNSAASAFTSAPAPLFAPSPHDGDDNDKDVLPNWFDDDASAPSSLHSSLPPPATQPQQPPSLLDESPEPPPMVEDPSPSNIVDTQSRLVVNRDAPLPSTHMHAAQLNQGFVRKASFGTGATTSLDVLQEQFVAIQQSIYEENNGVEFNINSVKKTSRVLFGVEGESTKKDRLEAMAGAGNRMAGLILDYRALKNRIRKLERESKNKEQGTTVKSALGVKRVVNNTDESREDMSDPVVLLDASAYIFRAYHTTPAMHRPDGMPTGAVMGFCRMLNKLLLGSMLSGEQPRVVLCFDAKEGKTFRHDMYQEYKQNRPPAPMDLIPQFALVRQAAEAYGLCQIEAPAFEADDVIATLSRMAREEGVDTNILSGDKDLMQLVTGLDVSPSVQVIDPKENRRTTYTEVVDQWGVSPEKLGDVLALAGDSVDNIPGVRGIGPKTAANLIHEFGDLDTLLDNVNSIKQTGVRNKLLAETAKTNAKLSRVLVELNRTIPLEQMTGFPEGVSKVSDLRMGTMDPDRILKFYDDMNFRKIKYEFESKLKNIKNKRRPSRRPEKVEIPKPSDYRDVPF